MSTARATRPPIDIATAFEQLLELSWELPVSEGDDAVVRAMVSGLAAVLPMCGVGVCYVENPVRLGNGKEREGGQKVVLQHAPGERADGRVDPTRLFPDYPGEVIVEVSGDPGGATVHAAFQDPFFVGNDSLVRRVLRRAALVLKRAREHAEAHALAHAARHSVMTLNAPVMFRWT